MRQFHQKKGFGLAFPFLSTPLHSTVAQNALQRLHMPHFAQAGYTFNEIFDRSDGQRHRLAQRMDTP